METSGGSAVTGGPAAQAAPSGSSYKNMQCVRWAGGFLVQNARPMPCLHQPCQKVPQPDSKCWTLADQAANGTHLLLGAEERGSAVAGGSGVEMGSTKGRAASKRGVAPTAAGGECCPHHRPLLVSAPAASGDPGGLTAPALMLGWVGAQQQGCWMMSLQVPWCLLLGCWVQGKKRGLCCCCFVVMVPVGRAVLL